MSSKVLSAAVIGLDAELVEVEADTGGGEMGKFEIVGLPDAAVNESRARVRMAVKNSNFEFPKLKVTVNLAPADLKKHGPSYDLPIAVSVLTKSGDLPQFGAFRKKLFVGELALNGELRPINGVLPIAIKAHQAGIEELYVPAQNSREAKLVKGISVIPILNLRELVNHLSGRSPVPPAEESEVVFENTESMFDMAHIRGQEHAKRAMEIAAAGGHNMMMSGTPGAGKTLIARTLPTILPDLILDEALEVTKIYSVAGMIPSGIGLVTSRPFRSPHHTASGVALVGGGAWPRPGEISLAHRGVLFLDEFAEFPRHVLENLRQPLEDGIIHISRAAGSLKFPAKFILVAAMNPCPCGYSGDREKSCQCSPGSIVNYKKKISGPIIDRIDLHVDVPRVEFDKLTNDTPGEASATIKARVESARKIQRERFKHAAFVTNSEMSSEAVKKHCPIDNETRIILKSAVEIHRLSARSYFRILKLARTIADLAGEERIICKNVNEALLFRPTTD
jgi:magnesium chelatase family protein